MTSHVKWLHLTLQIFIYMLREIISTVCINIFLNEMNKRNLANSALK